MRNILIQLLFTLLRVRYNTKSAIVKEDIKFLSDKVASADLISSIEKKFDFAKAETYYNEDYVEYLYYILRDHERRVAVCIDPKLRVGYQGVILFLLRHLQDLHDSYEKINQMSPSAKHKLKKKIQEAKAKLFN